ncbi:hypothetical protein EIN_083030 [Entamoeba invadens IP1]|uniref:hypothetical protein n=1 Tax=Entamoeba invadens IP1 TaxID=370355 RepID=UPI0002C3E274|nr:hypothetical protein EIN_083030 [Entamoeba invadens IP1]ELP85191.1 hypothetical protein EIN_083030 [Entamoeba invadens IP1]|eukprot:XP_004184537.1 hypothetical protein EIN_083030 [Entamoeba invadens IP1]
MESGYILSLTLFALTEWFLYCFSKKESRAIPLCLTIENLIFVVLDLVSTQVTNVASFIGTTFLIFELISIGTCFILAQRRIAPNQKSPISLLFGLVGVFQIQCVNVVFITLNAMLFLGTYMVNNQTLELVHIIVNYSFTIFFVSFVKYFSGDSFDNDVKLAALGNGR